MGPADRIYSANIPQEFYQADPRHKYSQWLSSLATGISYPR